MTGLSSAFDTALAGPAVVMFGAVSIALPGETVRLVDGAGFVTFAEETWVGRDPVFGVLGGLTEIGDGVDDEAPSITLTLLPPTNEAMAALAAPDAQGSTVMVWVGAMDPVTGTVIGDPDLVFLGELDVPTQKVRQGDRALDITVISIFDRFLEQNEGTRLNVGFHQTRWPDELGLEFLSFIRDPAVWGADGPKAVRNSGQSLSAGGGYPGNSFLSLLNG